MLKWEDAEKIEELLKADRYESKDWKAGSLSERIEWLISMYEFKKQEVNYLENKVIEKDEELLKVHCMDNELLERLKNEL